MSRRVALTFEQKKDYMVSDLPHELVKMARKKGMCQKDLAKALGITPQAFHERFKTKQNGKPRDSFTYGDLIVLFHLLGVTGDERDKLFCV